MRTSVVILCICLCGLSGCEAESVEGKASLHELDHVVAGHWPTSVEDAAAKIEQRRMVLNQEMATGVSGEAEVAAKELRDLLSWIPEIAADTDMPESKWELLASESEAILKQYQRQGYGEELGERIKQFANELAGSWPAKVAEDE